MLDHAIREEAEAVEDQVLEEVADREAVECVGPVGVQEIGDSRRSRNHHAEVCHPTENQHASMRCIRRRDRN